MPPEWKKHQGTVTAYPEAYETFFDRIDNARETVVKMVKLISEGETVHILVSNENSERDLRERLKRYDTLNVNIIRLKTDDVWCRDFCPIFVKRNGDTVGVKFKFNSWGGKYPFENDEKAGNLLPELLGIEKINVDMILEGGSIEVNGDGVLLTTESCLLNKNRNPAMSKGEIEDTIKKYLGISKIYYLGEGIIGDDTDGHIDDITRFVSDDTILTAIEEDKSDPNYYPLKENFERLKYFKNINGKPFNIVTVPMPEPQYYKYPHMDRPYRLPASYLNFYISNKYVIVPTFNCKNDEIALDILRKLFPDRKVVGLYAYDVVIGLGAFHCLTQQIPV
ncbi:agmatine deiminase family protein [Persephonella sp.]